MLQVLQFYHVPLSIATDTQECSSFSLSVFYCHILNVQVWHKVMDFLYYFQYYPQQIITLKSTWEYEEGPDSSNITGIVSMVSPFDGYRKGALISRVRVSSDWDITGAADMNIDTRKYTLTLEGVNLNSLLLISNCLLWQNVV
jgi:hypothetical protein